MKYILRPSGDQPMPLDSVRSPQQSPRVAVNGYGEQLPQTDDVSTGRSDQQPAGGIAGAVVEPHPRDIDRKVDRSTVGAAVAVEQHDVLAGSHSEAAVGTQQRDSDGQSLGLRPDHRVIAPVTGMHLPVTRVSPDQPVRADVPQRVLTELSARLHRNMPHQAVSPSSVRTGGTGSFTARGFRDRQPYRRSA